MKCNESDMNIYYKIIFEYNLFNLYFIISPLPIIYSISIVRILMMLWWHDYYKEKRWWENGTMKIMNKFVWILKFQKKNQ